MKSTGILSIVFAVLGVAAANKLAKEQLCTEVCWTHNNNDFQNCKDRCTGGEVSAIFLNPVTAIAD